MEVRRQTLVENGHNIRKINQAYFAFTAPTPTAHPQPAT